MQHDDLDRSFERLNRAEEYKRSALGYGFTKQGQALRREYETQLAHRIGVARGTERRNKALWLALKGIDDKTLALRLLTAGISVCGSDDLGIDKDGEKNFRDIALWIGRNLGHGGKIGFKVGARGVDLLVTLPCFAIDDEGILRPTAQAIDFVDDVLAEAVKNNALLSPLLDPPPAMDASQQGRPTVGPLGQGDAHSRASRVTSRRAKSNQ
jgi:hypothetical protein